MSVHAERVEQPLAELLQETTQAHFLHALAVPEALVVLRERHGRVRDLLQLDCGQEQHPCAALLLDHFQLMLVTELAWIERAIAVLQARRSSINPEENVGSGENGGY
jgi:hypothetical protein